MAKKRVSKIAKGKRAKKGTKSTKRRILAANVKLHDLTEFFSGDRCIHDFNY